MTDNEAIVVWNDLVKKHGDNLPDPEQCPREFAHLLNLYMYERYLNEHNKNPQG